MKDLEDNENLKIKGKDKFKYLGLTVFETETIEEEIKNRMGQTRVFVSDSKKKMNYTELNYAKEIIPQYKGGSKNLSYYIQQSEKFINLFQNQEQVQKNCTFNRLLYEICCSKLTGTARDVLIISNCQTWSQVKTALINRFGHCINENLLENDLIACFQLTNESYQDYYERIRTKLQCLLEQINTRINEDNESLKNYKIQILNKKALATYLSGLVEPYYSFMNYHTVNSLEECLLKLKD
ncbi:hypothetical protein FQA39_LY09779 [Lamprigera yunnana]|nr:hypothetical protein FQA39_LY09779 [Lamprigera yunnana]